jgi:protein-disulfide isomerase
MATKQKTSSSKLTRRQAFARQKERQHQRTRLLWFLAGLAIVGVMAFTLWPKNPAAAPSAPISSTSLLGEISLDKSTGEEKAPVIVVEYGDFQCPACQYFFQTSVKQLKDEYVQSGKVRFVFRQYAFLGDESQWAAEASECANEQGRFWDYYDKLYQEQNGENVGIFSKDNLKKFAVDLKLDTAGFNQCLDAGRYTEKVKQETQEGQQAGVRGTPSVFVNGQYVEEGINYPTLKAAVEAALGE